MGDGLVGVGVGDVGVGVGDVGVGLGDGLPEGNGDGDVFGGGFGWCVVPGFVGLGVGFADGGPPLLCGDGTGSTPIGAGNKLGRILAGRFLLPDPATGPVVPTVGDGCTVTGDWATAAASACCGPGVDLSASLNATPPPSTMTTAAAAAIGHSARMRESARCVLRGGPAPAC